MLHQGLPEKYPLYYKYAKKKKIPSPNRQKPEIYTLFSQLWWNSVTFAE